MTPIICVATHRGPGLPDLALAVSDRPDTIWTATVLLVSKSQVIHKTECCGEGCEGLHALISGLISRRHTLRIWTDRGLDFLVESQFLIWRHAVGIADAWMTIDCPPLIFRGKSDAGAVELASIENWVRGDVTDAYRWVDLDPPIERDLGLEFTDLLRSCRRRSDFVARLVTKLTQYLHQNGGGRLAPTAAMQSMRWWRRVWGRRPPERTSDTEIAAMERHAYYGGRVDLGYHGIVSLDGNPNFRLSKSTMSRLKILTGTRAHYCDIRSAYPAAMIDLAAPMRLSFSADDMSLSSAEDLAHEYCLISRVLVRSVEIPWPYRRGGQSMMVCGRYWTVLCGDELIEALRLGCIERIGQTAVYQTAQIFGEWVSILYDLREKSSLEDSQFAVQIVKTMLNSLHGKFGQRPEGWIIDPDTLPPLVLSDGRLLDGVRPEIVGPDGRILWGTWRSVDPVTGEVRRHRVLDGRVQTWGQREPGRWTSTAIAAAISAACRVRLGRILRSLTECGWLYCDTDSVHVTDSGLEKLTKLNLLGKTGIGTLRVVDSADQALYLQKRVYCLGNRWVVSGKPESIQDVHDLIYIATQRESIESLISRGFLDGPHCRTLKCELSTEYHGGAVGPEGWVRPWLILDV